MFENPLLSVGLQPELNLDGEVRSTVQRQTIMSESYEGRDDRASVNTELPSSTDARS
jgi:hypothetical protein